MVDNLINIYDEDGQEINLSSLGLTGLKLGISSPSYRTITKEIDGHVGVIVVDRVLNPRSLTAEFISKANDYVESLALRDKLYGWLGNGRKFYVSDTNIPMRRWNVYLESWTPDRIDVKHHRFDIPLFAESGTSESTTMIKKKYTSTNFKFNNRGNQLINPRYHSDIEIEFSGNSSNLIIKNVTNGDVWSWTGETVDGDTILLKGIRSLKNNMSIFGQTNKKLITLNSGWNEFEILGVSEGDFELTIRTRFYFL